MQEGLLMTIDEIEVIRNQDGMFNYLVYTYY